MAKDKLHPIPAQDPVTGKPLHISELACEESGIVIKGKFEIPRYSRLDPDQALFLETFLRCRGMISCVEKELGISYPTARARLDALLQALDFAPVKEDVKKEKASDVSAKNLEHKRQVLERLEAGEITPDEAKKQLRGESAT